jgi:hypothetical protein
MNAILNPSSTLESSHRSGRIETESAYAEVQGDAIVIHDAAGQAVASYSQQGGLRIIAQQGDITIAAPQGRVIIEARELVHNVGKWELRAQRLVERVVDAYRDASGIAETRSGRLRCIVDGALQMLAARTSITSDEDTTIDGKRVLLG